MSRMCGGGLNREHCILPKRASLCIHDDCTERKNRSIFKGVCDRMKWENKGKTVMTPVPVCLWLCWLVQFTRKTKCGYCIFLFIFLSAFLQPEKHDAFSFHSGNFPLYSAIENYCSSGYISRYFLRRTFTEMGHSLVEENLGNWREW